LKEVNDTDGYTVGGKLIRHASGRLGEVCRGKETVARLAGALRLTVIAEGVETEGQSEILRCCGCGQSQGFLFSPPMSPVAIDALAKRGRHPMPLFIPPVPLPLQSDALSALVRGLTAA
jgi:predicted signal transduction protein with EAL and GGDEF domain